jgi:putative ABC transport system substrate-binding protein
MQRREFIGLIGGVAASWPLAALAQQAMPLIGFLGSGTAQTFTPHVNGFLDGLKEAGFVDRRNLAIEYSWAEGKFERLPALAAGLVGRPVDVLATVGGNVSALAAKSATSTIPIVFLTADDPVASGLVGSLNRPGGNMTGVTWLGAELGAKNLELVHQLLPSIAVIGVLVNPTRPTAEAQLENAQEAGKAFGKEMRVLRAVTRDDIDAVFKTIASERIGALFVASDPLFLIHRSEIISLAASYAVPTVYFLREFVVDGGLMSYGASLGDAAKLCGDYAARILKGAKPAGLPVQQSTKIEMIINLKTAKTLGLTIPPTLLARADEVIE